MSVSKEEEKLHNITGREEEESPQTSVDSGHKNAYKVSSQF